MKRTKVLFILPSLQAGGAERVISFVAKHLNSNKYAVKLVVLGHKKDSKYDIDGLDVVFIGKDRLSKSIWSVLRIILRFKPEIVLGTIVHVNIMLGFLAFFFRRIKFIGREASVVSNMLVFSRINLKKHKILVSVFYPNLSAIICQSGDILLDLSNNFGINSKLLRIINNPITRTTPLKLETRNSRIKHFLTIGRLSREKGHQRILASLAQIKNYEFHYIIIGDGPEKDNLIQFIEENNMKQHVTMLDYSSDVFSFIDKSDFYLQGSYVEGFPNALLESISSGVPAMVYNSPGGTRDIIIQGVNGIIVETQEEFTEMLIRIPELKLSPRRLIQETVSAKFSADKIIADFDLLFNDILLNQYNSLL